MALSSLPLAAARCVASAGALIIAKASYIISSFIPSASYSATICSAYAIGCWEVFLYMGHGDVCDHIACEH
jgi:hypothetical protein